MFILFGDAEVANEEYKTKDWALIRKVLLPSKDANKHRLRPWEIRVKGVEIEFS